MTADATSGGRPTRLVALNAATAGLVKEGRIVTVETYATPNGSGQFNMLGPHKPMAQGGAQIAMMGVRLRARRLAAMMGFDTDEAKGFIDLRKNEVDITGLTIPGDIVIEGSSGGSDGAVAVLLLPLLGLGPYDLSSIWFAASAAWFVSIAALVLGQPLKPWLAVTGRVTLR